MDPSTHLISLLLAPVVLISACGLLCLAGTNRLGTVLARMRAMHRERFDTFIAAQRDDPRFQRIQRLRLDMLQNQATHMLARATLIRNELFLLYVAVLLMLSSSLLFGLSAWFDTSRTVATGVFVSGIVAMIGAVLFAGVEIARSLQTIRYEHERVESLDEHASRDE